MASRSKDEEGKRQSWPLKRLHLDPQFWAKIAALWHRERVREAFLALGEPVDVARKTANLEALAVAREHGWRGDVVELKAQLAELLVNDLPELRRREGKAAFYWEEHVQQDMLELLALSAPQLRERLADYLREEVRTEGRFTGHAGFYRLAYLLGYVPTIEHLDRRNAFLAALSEVGNDSRLCDRELFRAILRFSRQYTLRPFETRLGFSMPDAPATAARPAPRRARRGILSRTRQDER